MFFCTFPKRFFPMYSVRSSVGALLFGKLVRSYVCALMSALLCLRSYVGALLSCALLTGCLKQDLNTKTELSQLYISAYFCKCNSSRKKILSKTINDVWNEKSTGAICCRLQVG